MVQENYPELSLPKEHVVISAEVAGSTVILSHGTYTLVTLEDGAFGILVKPGSVAQTLLEQPLFAVNVMLQPVVGLDEHRYYSTQELFFESTITKSRKIPALKDAIIAIESEPVHPVEAGDYLLYVCEMVGMQRMHQQSLKQRLKQLGVSMQSASSQP